VREANDD
jgi:hypothetical protein